MILLQYDVLQFGKVEKGSPRNSTEAASQKGRVSTGFNYPGEAKVEKKT